MSLIPETNAAEAEAAERAAMPPDPKLDPEFPYVVIAFPVMAFGVTRDAILTG